MIHNDLRNHKRRLLELRARLSGDVSQMAQTARTVRAPQGDEEFARMPIHMAELANETFEREVEVGLLGTKQATLAQIERALEALEEGTYGLCAECLRKIPKARLEVVPYATRCVRCAERAERTETADILSNWSDTDEYVSSGSR